ncbi:MAG: antA/AntB antirepressor family protein [Capnocytophaga sp.]|nr:antA/AntB antirepressor family protein [Capnocytophaga sp.]
MTQLITITEQQGVQLVDARELHRKLKIGRMFSHWIKERIDEYGFLESEDYFIEKQTLAKFGKQVRHNKIDYHITTDMAKELAMVERNDTGRKIRRYFIEIEKNTRKNLLPIPKPLNIHGMEALPYIEWSLQHGYSVTGGNFHRRIRRHAGHFYRTSAGKWYISTEFAKGLLNYREGERQLNKIKLLPGHEQLEMF